MEEPRPRVPRAVLVLAVLYVVLAAAIGLWPRHVDSGLGVEAWPLTTTIADVLSVPASRVVDGAEVLANTLFFVPVGAVVAVALPRASVLLAVAAGLAIAVVIELVQGLGPLDRTASLLDVVADVAGAVLGFGAVRAASSGSPAARAAVAMLAAVVLVVLGVLLAGLVIPGD
ncbi:VanZ family protein [Aeromicrobium choanae]|uniref:VanZ like family protein n=1 Tax=Aeromicrobium choanae TaxID=1736691 RepID=A0A1T4Z196_9ACTN|nr:VanZ family protein [Aeromicrobium choanae]SKB07325.1 VanZ like family protein [Aeromicrobium choanae]